MGSFFSSFAGAAELQCMVLADVNAQGFLTDPYQGRHLWVKDMVLDCIH